MARINWTMGVWLVLIIIGFAYRTYDLGHDSYWIDESYTVLASKNIGEYGHPKFDSGENYWAGFPHTYGLFIIGEVFGYDHVPMRALSVLFGTAFIILIYFLVKEQFDEKIALLTAFFIAFSYIEIAWSRQARWYIILQFFLFLSVLLYVRFLKDMKARNLVLLLCSIIISIALNPAGLLIPIILFLHYIIVKRTSAIKEFFAYFRNVGMRPSMFVLLLSLASVIIYFVYKELMRFEIVANYVNTYINFMFANHHIFIFLAVIGFFAYKKRFEDNLLYLIMFLIVFIGATMTVIDVNFRYIFIVIPVLYILASEAIIYFYELFQNKVGRIAIVIVFIVLVFLSGFLFIPKNSYALESGTPQPPFKDAYAYVGENLMLDDILVVTQPAISELYLRKADYWLAIAYENRGTEHYVDRNTGIERYTGIITIIDYDGLDKVVGNNGDTVIENKGYIVIDDMGISRLPVETRSRIQNLTLMQSYGDRFWSRVYVYGFGKD